MGEELKDIKLTDEQAGRICPGCGKLLGMLRIKEDKKCPECGADVFKKKEPPREETKEEPKEKTVEPPIETEKKAAKPKGKKKK